MRTGPTRREFLTSCAGTATVAAASVAGSTTGLAQTTEDWPMFGYDQANTGYNPSTSGPTESAGPAWEFQTDGAISSSAAVVDGTVYIGSRDENVYALDAESGHELWRFETGSGVRSSPAVVPAPDDGADGDRRVYVGNQEGIVFALDADSGESVWRFGTDDSVISSPVFVDNTVYVGSQDSTLYAIDATDGTERWAFETEWFVESTPAVVDGTVYVGSDDGTVYALDATDGETVWEFTTAAGIQSSPAVADGTVYVGSLEQSLYALDAESGERRWVFEAGGTVTGSPAVVSSGSDSSLAGTVFIGAGSPSHKLYAVDTETGDSRWEFDAGRPIRASPAVADGVVYVGSSSQNVYGVDAESGDELWQFDTGRSVSAAPTVVDGTVYIGSENSKVYALREGFAAQTEATPRPATGDGGGAGDFRFLVVPSLVVGFSGFVVSLLYAFKRFGLLDPLYTEGDTVGEPFFGTAIGEDSSDDDGTVTTAESDQSSSSSADGADDTSFIWDAMIGDVISRADETEKTATQDVLVSKHLDTGTLASPVVAYEIESLRNEPATVRLTEPLLDSDEDSQPMGNGWSVDDGDVVFEAVVDPSETATTLVGRRDCPTEDADELLESLSVTVEET